MGWKTSLIIISGQTQIEDLQILTTLGIKGTTKVDNITFEETIAFLTNKVCIGRYNKNLIIYEWAIPEKVLHNKGTDIEKLLCDKFPNAEICFIELVSTLNFWGYKIIQSGQLIRHFVGDGQGNGTFFNVGNPLTEEKELLDKATVDENGVRTYKFENDESDEVLTEDQMGEEFIFNLCKRYLGHTLDESETFLNEVEFSCYKKKSWWQFWK